MCPLNVTGGCCASVQSIKSCTRRSRSRSRAASERGRLFQHRIIGGKPRVPLRGERFVLKRVKHSFRLTIFYTPINSHNQSGFRKVAREKCISLWHYATIFRNDFIYAQRIATTKVKVNSSLAMQNVKFFPQWYLRKTAQREYLLVIKEWCKYKCVQSKANEPKRARDKVDANKNGSTHLVFEENNGTIPP